MDLSHMQRSTLQDLGEYRWFLPAVFLATSNVYNDISHALLILGLDFPILYLENALQVMQGHV